MTVTLKQLKEFLDVNSGERIAQFEKVQGSLTVTVGPQEEEQDSCHMDKWESDMFERTSKYPPVGRVQGTGAWRPPIMCAEFLF